MQAPSTIASVFTHWRGKIRNFSSVVLNALIWFPILLRSPFTIAFLFSASHPQVYSLSTPARSIHSNSSNPKDKLRRIAVSPDTIICQQLAQEGTYGRIFYGVLHHPLGETRDVLIKTVVGKSVMIVGVPLAFPPVLCVQPNAESNSIRLRSLLPF